MKNPPKKESPEVGGEEEDEKEEGSPVGVGELVNHHQLELHFLLKV